MKKALTLVLALAITLGVTGCTKKTGNPTNETSQTTVSEEKIEFDVKAAYEANKISNLLKTAESVKEIYEYDDEISYTEYFLDNEGNIGFLSYMDDHNVTTGNYKGVTFDYSPDENFLHLSSYIIDKEENGFGDFSIAYFLDEYKVINVTADEDSINVEMKISEIFECEPVFVEFEKDTLRLLSFDDGVVSKYEYGEFGNKELIQNVLEGEKITVNFNVETHAGDGSVSTTAYTIDIPKGSVFCPYETYEGYFAYYDAEYTKSAALDYYAAPFTDGMTIYLTNAAG